MVKVGLLLVLAAGCSDSTPGKTITLAWITKDATNLVFTTGTDGAFTRARELTTKGPNQVKVIDLSPPSSDATSQIASVQSAIDHKVQGIAISVIDATQLVDVINKAVAAGIQVMTWDSDAPGSQRFTFSAIDNFAVGTASAKLVAKLLGGKGKTAVWTTGTSSTMGISQNVGARVEAFRTEINMHSGMSFVEPPLACQNTTPAKDCVLAFDAFCNANPDITGWFFPSVWLRTVAAVPANDPNRDPALTPMCWAAGNKAGTIKTVAVDTLARGLTLVDDNEIQALIGQHYWGWGYDSIEILYEKLTTKKSFPAYINTGFDVVCSDNVGAMESEWISHDFTVALPPCSLAQGIVP
jgi:ribose transport system substrate-binding protein